MPKDKDELADELEREQMTWDSYKRYYDDALNGEPMHKYKFNTAKDFAKEEGLEFDCEWVEYVEA